MRLFALDHHETVGSVIKKHAGMTSGFDYLRIGLALSIVVWHGFWTTRGHDAEIWHSVWRPFPASMLPMFFCLSGFLVSGSLFRTPSIKDFLLLRAIRIIPALFVETFLCAILLGTALTTLPLNEYFSDPLFRQYLFNMIGYVHFFLPGLFMSNPVPGVVNINLWTLPAELYCYVALSLLAIFKIIHRPRLLLFLVLVCVVAATVRIMPHAEMQQWGRPTPHTLVVSFLFGVVFYLLRDSIPCNRPMFLAAVLFALILLSKAATQFIAVPFVAYITVYLGLLNPPKKTFLLRGDYSYGLYLFGFPMQQVYCHLVLPHVASPVINWFGSVGFGLSLGLLYAFFSWHLVEKPILKKKNAIIAAINKLIPKKAFRNDATKSVVANSAAGGD